jgi:hypothetical protein
MPFSSIYYWNLPVSTSNQRLSFLSDEQKTSMTETTVAKSVLNRR